MTQPLDHKALIASLTPETRRMLCGQSDGPGLARIGIQLGLIGGLGTYIQAGLPLWQAALLPQGLLIVFLFTALHETIHGTAFRTRWLNTVAAHICGLAVLVAPRHLRYFHMAHHRFTHDPDNDPELSAPKPATSWQYLKHLSGLPEWARRIRTFFAVAIAPERDAFVPARARRRVQAEAVMFVLLYGATLTAFWPVLLWSWLIPLLIGGPFLRAYLLAEHALCPHVANMLANTRTTFTNRAVRWLAWNMPYHAEHHAYPAVPFHKLPVFHSLARAHLCETEKGYTRFNKRYLETIEA